MKLENKVVIITGGTSGIGLATCEKMAEMGAKVYACARHERNFVNRNIIYHPLDVTNFKSCERLYQDVIEADHKIDILVADAGIVSDNLTKKMTENQFDEVINTNLKGVYNIVKLVGPHMEEMNNGNIITISSIVGEFGNIGQVNYAASKAGVIGMTKTWAKEFARKGKNVRVNAVAPGYVMTDMLNTVPKEILEKFKNMTMLKRLGQPSEVANVISFLASDEASYITGAVIDVNGGLHI